MGLPDMIFCDGNPKTAANPKGTGQRPCDFWKEGRYPGIDMCLNFVRPDGYGLVRHGTWDSKPPYQYCENVRQRIYGGAHVCPFYKPKREAKGD